MTVNYDLISTDGGFLQDTLVIDSTSGFMLFTWMRWSNLYSYATLLFDSQTFTPFRITHHPQEENVSNMKTMKLSVLVPALGTRRHWMDKQIQLEIPSQLEHVNDDWTGLMEDATDFSWKGAQVAHAVMLCEMERDVLDWEDSERIDRIYRTHAQKQLVTKC